MKVADKVRQNVEVEARRVLTATKAKVPSATFNQDLCAVTAYNECLRIDREDLDDADKQSEKLQTLYICANASALRQALDSEKKSKGAQITAGLLDLIQE